MGSPLTVLVGRRESFNAAHQLRDPGLSEEENRRLFGKCVNLHGHNYVLDVVVAGQVDESSGYVLDLKQLSSVVCRQVVHDVGHRHLNTHGPWLESRKPPSAWPGSCCTGSSPSCMTGWPRRSASTPVSFGGCRAPRTGSSRWGRARDA